MPMCNRKGFTIMEAKKNLLINLVLLVQLFMIVQMVSLKLVKVVLTKLLL